MQLLGSATSPFVRKIRIVLYEKQQDFEWIEDVPWNADCLAQRYNPLVKVPVLISDSGQTWYDSAVIAEYLETLPASLSLAPRTALERAQMRQWEALADGIADAGVAIFLELKRPLEQQSESWIARQEQKIGLGIRNLSEILAARNHPSDFLFQELSVADIAMGCCLSWLRYRLGEREQAQLDESVCNYLENLERRDSFRKTRPPEL